jgi:hypothetical protein
MNPKYPIYIPSKGRWSSRLTSKALELMRVPYYIVVEPQELDKYAAVIDKQKILVLPWSKPDSYSELVKTRNWIKNHSIKRGDERHWQLDDNINGFMRLNRNRKIKVASGTVFRVAEQFVDRYENVVVAGFNYDFFAKARQKIPPFYINTRIYSCTLMSNKHDYFWRGIYNDDTDICLRVLKDGHCTILFNAFLACKATTMSVKGGNTPIYQGDGRLKMARSLVEQHPDVVRLTWKFGKYHHQVDYSDFQKYNKLIKKADIKTLKGVNNYGMKLIEIDAIEQEEAERTSQVLEDFDFPIDQFKQASLF